MKFLSISILLTCLMAATFPNWLEILSFRANQNYIAKNLCINRDNPGSHCNGHCYLCKQLDKNQQPAGANGLSGKERTEIQLFYAPAPAFIPYRPLGAESFRLQGQTLPAQPFLSTLFHPPCA